MESGAVTTDVSIRFEPLATRRKVAEFSCGRAALDDFLKKFALNAPNQGLSQTFAGVAGDDIVSFYTLAGATIDRIDATERFGKGMPHYPIPVVLLARLAVARPLQGQGLGDVTMLHALGKAVALAHFPRMADGSPGLPLRGLIVEAIDADAAAFYRKWGFTPSPAKPLLLMASLKELRKSLAEKRLAE